MSKQNVKNVIIAGAGPAGLLLSALLLRRNKLQDKVQYKVTLVEPRPDLGELDPETDLKVHRSWMLGLAGHGLEAIRTIPELWDEYVSEVGVQLLKFSIYLGSKEIVNEVENAEESRKKGQEGFIVDRNFVVASISRYLNDKHGSDSMFTRKYLSKIMYVDYENHRVLVRNEDNKEEYLPYDLLVGADGIRSVVREALVKRHFDFEMDVGDIFQYFKAVHVTRPKHVRFDSMSLLPGSLPHGVNGIALPEKDGQLNISFGAPRNVFDKVAPELKSDDPKVVADYFRKHFKAFELDDYDDFAQKFVECRWNRTGMAHCNFYHSNACKIVIMGDAAHATSPSIGMGMNTALRDAQKFHEILVEMEDDLGQVLPQFSKTRVKEGNALTDLAYYLYCFDTTHQLIETIHMLARGFLNKIFPSLVQEHPQSMVGNPAYTLADCYQAAYDQGIIQKHRRINDEGRREFFEKQTGMISENTSRSSKWTTMLRVLVPALVVGVCYHAYSNGTVLYK